MKKLSLFAFLFPHISPNVYPHLSVVEGGLAGLCRNTTSSEASLQRVFRFSIMLITSTTLEEAQRIPYFSHTSSLIALIF